MPPESVTLSIAADAEQIFSWSETHTTPDLRLVRRGADLVLQQRFVTTTRTSQTSEWHDVPVVEDGQADS